MIKTLTLAFVLLLVAIASMAIGVMVNKDKAKGELKGSCGGPSINPDCCMNKSTDCTKELPTKNGLGGAR